MFNWFNKKNIGTNNNYPQGNSGIAGLFSDIARILSRSTKIDPKLFDELEEKLLRSDLGVSLTQEIMEKLKYRSRKEINMDSNSVMQLLHEEFENILAPCAIPFSLKQSTSSQVILFVGVNGSGKTTTLGKIAHLMKERGHSILLAAGDTFRAAAIEQLKIWGERTNIPVIAQQPGADSAAVIYDALQAGRARDVDLVMADTAGRLHTHDGLMQELKKIKRTLQKIDPQAPQEILLVLDATIGQNAINQAREFHEAIGITGIAITKLDGTAKGGAIFAIAKSMKLPIYFLGMGEKIEDLKPFDARQFVATIFNENYDRK